MKYKKKFVVLSTLLILIFVIGACGAPAAAPADEAAEAAPTEAPAEEAAEAEPTEAPAEEEAAVEEEVGEMLAAYVPSYSAHWSYEGETGPEFWGSLDPDYAACSEGMEQSPVDVITDAPVNPDDVAYAYSETTLNIVNNGHAIQVNVDEGSSTAEVDGTSYALEQLHFHSPSEHTVAGENMAMEMHLVHHDAEGNSAVISALLVEGAENPAFAPIWENMPVEEGDPVTIEGVAVNPDDLLPEDRSYYHYMGSLTTPACTEGVNWHVLTTPVELSADQLAAFRTIHDGTNRPVQPMNDREFLGN